MMSKIEFKKILKSKLKIKKREFLNNLQNVHSKTKRLCIEDEPQKYLTSKLLSTSLKQFLFLLRCNMTRNKTNYKQMHFNLACRLCKNVNSEESLVHLSVCSFVQKHVPEILRISIDDIYDEVEKQIRAVKIWRKVFEYIEEYENYQEHIKCASCT